MQVGSTGERGIDAGARGIDIAACYQRFGGMVLRRCRRLLRDEAAAVDAMHDVFVRLCEAGARLEDRGLSSLLYRMATQVCLNHLRTRRRHPEHPGEELLLRIAAMEEIEGRTAAGQLLQRLFAREPESTRVLAVLHLVDGLTLEEVAGEVGLSVSGVRKRLARLRERLDGLDTHVGLKNDEAA